MGKRPSAAAATVSRRVSAGARAVRAAAGMNRRAASARERAALLLFAAAVAALSAVAWPLVPFAAGLLPDSLPVERLLWGAGLAAVAVGAWKTWRGRKGPVWLGWLVLGAWGAAAAAVAGTAAVAWLLLGSPGLDAPERLSPADLDAIATRAFAVVAGLGAVAALVISYRRQRLTEADVAREDTRLFTERFTAASAQLGDERPAVCLAGVHALAHLADDAPTRALRQMCVDVLCAYLRMPYDPEPGPLPGGASRERREEHRRRSREFAALREVRHTVLRVIGDRLREATAWRGHHFDFTGAVFDGGDLSGARFTGGRVDFSGAHFAAGTVSFSGAVFAGSRVSFRGAVFSGGTVDFTRAVFSAGEVSFGQAEFSGSRVDLGGARFSEGVADFTGARVTAGRLCFGSGAPASGTPPKGLREAAAAAPDVVRLPLEWMSAAEH